MSWLPEVDPSGESEAWVASGAFELTGRADGLPQHAPGAPASAVRAALTAISRARPGALLPGVELLSMRAEASGAGRKAPWSCGGAFRICPTRDGWFGLSLARESDRELVPALVEGDVADAWAGAEAWMAERETEQVARRVALLGLPGGAILAEPPEGRRDPVRATAVGERLARSRSPLVVDLSSLWAGPLCGALLARTGARVVKVEGRHRPDGSRSGPIRFFEWLNGAKELRVFDLKDSRGVDELRRLLAAADVVIEGSRPRALAQLGISAQEWATAGRVWVSITGYGREGDDGMRVGFGDDVAAAAGFVLWDDVVGPSPVGDALADPLTGTIAAAAAVTALDRGRGVLLDVSMFDVALWARRIGTAAGPALSGEQL